MTKQVESKMRREQHPLRVLLFCVCLAMLGWATAGWALDASANTADPLLSPLIPVMTPMYMEKTVGPLALGQETGWQVGGLNTQFDSKSDDSALSLRGGLFFSRRLGPRQVLDPSVPLPDNRFGQQFDESAAGGNLGVPGGMLFGNAGGQNGADQITYQRVNFSSHGLSLSGSYADVGKDFQGLDVLVKQMAAGDAEGAKLLALGQTRSRLAASYTGVKNLEMAYSLNSLANDQKGHSEYGLSRSEQEQRIRYAFGNRHSISFRSFSKVDEWDPEAIKRDTTSTKENTLNLTLGLAKKSEFSLGQTSISSEVGAKETDTRQQNLSLKWNEWQALSLTGAYQKKHTAQTDELNRMLSLGLTTTVLPRMQITGNLVRSETERPGVEAVRNDQLNLKVVTQLMPSLQVTSLYQEAVTPDKGEVTVRDQQMAWTLAPRWKMSSRLLSNDSEKLGETSRAEYLVSGDVGAAGRAEQLSLFSRTDTLPNEVGQTRQEIGYTRALGGGQAPVTLKAQVGQYALEKPDAQQGNGLLTVQLLSLRPLPRATLSLGYYGGPVLGANYLAYRAWGQKPQGNLELWTDKDFVPYRETGGELIYALTDATRLVMKQFAGEREDTGEVKTTEYGFEQKLGRMSLLAGRRSTAQTSGIVDEQWWRITLPGARPLADWAATSTRYAVFTDSATWGLTQPAAWVLKPESGLFVEQRRELVAGKPASAAVLRYATMCGDRLLLQASYERDPRKADNANAIDPTERQMLHLGYRIDSSLQVFARFQHENRRDNQPSLRTDSLGIVGTLSNASRLHLQADLMKREGGTATAAGTACMLGYERVISDDDTLLIKYRIFPHGFTQPQDRIRLEAGLQRAF